MPENSTDNKTERIKSIAEEVLSKEKGKEGLNFGELKALAEELKSAGEKSLAEQINKRADDIKEADKTRARTILGSRGSTPDEMLSLAKRLAGYKQIGYARRLLDHASKPHNQESATTRKVSLEIKQKRAVYTYKDPDIPLVWRLKRAWENLKSAENFSNTETEDDPLTTNPETLGIAGAICKREWEIDGQRKHLEKSLRLYLRGYAQGAPTPEARKDILDYLRKTENARLDADKNERGYPGINAAFILDLLAELEEKEAENADLRSELVERMRLDANLIRGEITRSVPPLIDSQDWLKKEWWFYATVGEAYFGLGKYESARQWLIDKPKAAGLFVPEWEYESTARQLTRLALLEQDADVSEADFEKTEAGKLLRDFLKGNEKKLSSAFRGKIGLALSGGGFRASLYHIGVLAKLAERDVLRHIETISCVSGGSIIGTYYYLELRQLLQSKRDDDITQQDYIDIVKRIEKNFLEGVQRNIRTRVLAEFATNLKMIFYPGYSRTRRVGELYERELFSRIDDQEGEYEGYKWLPSWLARLFGYKRKERFINDLLVHPRVTPAQSDTDYYPNDSDWRKANLDADFAPKNHNWKRANKVPVLILNATTLNTGHIWQFTATFMGEPPDVTINKIDCNYRLRRMYYDEAPDPYKKFRLGYAVAASSGVPVIFEPLILDKLYRDNDAEDEKEISVRLVDGGVYDNQGYSGLLEQDCNVLLVSDASGQLRSENVPSSKSFNVIYRSIEVLMQRITGIQYREVEGRKTSSLVRGLMLVHLNQELTGKGLAWEKCPPERKFSEFESEDSYDLTKYGIFTDIQKLISSIRTDLDSFTEAEAYALMMSGYRMTDLEFTKSDKSIEGFDKETKVEWEFLKIDDSLREQGKQKEHLKKLLEVSSSVALKIWKLWLPLKIIKGILASVFLILLGTIGLALYLGGLTVNSLPRTIVDWIQKIFTTENAGFFILLMLALMVSRLIFTKQAQKILHKYVVPVFRWRDTVRNIAIGVGMCLLGWILARIHLHVFDKLYLWYGKLDKFPSEK